MNLKVKRVSVIDAGAFGVMLDDDVPFAVTLERTYLEDGKQVVKIPTGKLHCKRRYYNRGGYWTFEILVEGHQFILFHKANIETELEGCVAIGEQFGVLKGVPAILQSGAGFDEFSRKTNGLDEFDVIFE